MKLLVFLSAITLASTALANTTPRYVQEIISGKATALTNRALAIVQSPQVRAGFAEAFGFPLFKDYKQEKLAEGMSEDEIAELYRTMFINSELQDFEIEQALTKSPMLRAGVMTAAFLASSYLGALTQALGISTSEELTEWLKQNEPGVSPAQFLAGISQTGVMTSGGLTLIFPAIDNPDKNLEEITDDIAEIQMLKFDIHYSDAYADRVPEGQSTESNSAISFAIRDARGNILGGTLGDYLRRTNHVTPKAINDSERQFLTSIGITDEAIPDMMPSNLPRIIADFVLAGNPIMGSNPNLVGELDYAVVIDLISEPGSIHPMTVTPRIFFDQHQYDYFKKFLEKELEYLEITMDELVSLLRHPDRPASLFQVLQMRHKNFTIPDIADLEYETMDAIIISNHKDKETVFNELRYAVDKEHTIESLNELIATKGQLTLVLLDLGYDIDSIAEHFYPRRKPHDIPQNLAQKVGDVQ